MSTLTTDQAKPQPATAATFDAMLAIAERVATEHEVVINDWRNGSRMERMDWRFKPSVTPSRGTRRSVIMVTVEQNRVIDQERAHDLLVRTRRAIIDAWAAEGYTTGEVQQRARGGGRTWLHTGGLFHMGHQSTDWRRWCAVPREPA